MSFDFCFSACVLCLGHLFRSSPLSDNHLWYCALGAKFNICVIINQASPLILPLLHQPPLNISSLGGLSKFSPNREPANSELQILIILFMPIRTSLLSLIFKINLKLIVLKVVSLCLFLLFTLFRASRASRRIDRIVSSFLPSHVTTGISSLMAEN